MPWACCLGQGHPKDLSNDEVTIKKQPNANKDCLWGAHSADLAHDGMLWACCLWQGLFRLLANDEHTDENTIPTFLCSGDGNLASNEVQASSGK